MLENYAVMNSSQMMIKCMENQTNVKRSYKAKTSKQEKKNTFENI